MSDVSDTSVNDAIPPMRRAAASSLTFSSDARAVKELREEWICLAEDITHVVMAAATKVDDTAAHLLDKRTLNQVKELEDISSEAGRILTRSQSRGLCSIIKRLFRINASRSKIREYRERVRCLSQFFEALPMPSTPSLAAPDAKPTLSHHGTRPKFTFIPGDKVENNIKEVTNNIDSNRMRTINTINAHNVCN